MKTEHVVTLFVTGIWFFTAMVTNALNKNLQDHIPFKIPFTLALYRFLCAWGTIAFGQWLEFLPKTNPKVQPPQVASNSVASSESCKPKKTPASQNGASSVLKHRTKDSQNGVNHKAGHVDDELKTVKTAAGAGGVDKYFWVIGLTKAISVCSLYYGMRSVSVQISYIMLTSQPIFVVLIMFIVSREVYSKYVYLSLVPILVGLVVVGFSSSEFNLVDNIPILACALVACFTNLISKMIFDNSDYNGFTVYRSLCLRSFCFTLPVWLWWEFPTLNFIELEASVLLPLVLWGFVDCCYNTSQTVLIGRLSRVSFAVMGNAQRFFVITTSTIYFGDEMNGEILFGLGLVFVGVLLYVRSSNPSPEERVKVE